MIDPELNYFVNLQTYPIDRLGSEAGQDLLNRAHRMMKEDTLVEFPDFLRSQAVVALVEELTALESKAHRSDYMSTPYGWMDNSGFAPDHPRSALFRRNCGTITTELFSEHALSQRLFRVDELTEFVRRMLGYETLYRSACPTLSIQVNVMHESDRFGWHFDTNDGVVSFMIQNVDTGGAFEYVPLIRDEDDENYDTVSNVFDGSYEPRRPAVSAGALSLFLGRRSIHRVAPVGTTKRSRLSLLFSYDRTSGMVFPAESCQRFTSPSDEPYLGTVTKQE